MSELYSVDYAGLTPALIPLSTNPAEVHGGLCGFLCAGGVPLPGRWLEQLRIDADGLDAALGQQLETLRHETVHLLDDQELRFAPLLPADEVAMANRVEALAAWCSAFIGGYGLGGRSEALAEEAEEALRDLGRIAGFGYEAGEDEEDETALAEILEYVRVAVLVLRHEGQRSRPEPAPTRH